MPDSLLEGRPHSVLGPKKVNRRFIQGGPKKGQSKSSKCMEAPGRRPLLWFGDLQERLRIQLVSPKLRL